MLLTEPVVKRIDAIASAIFIGNAIEVLDASNQGGDYAKNITLLASAAYDLAVLFCETRTAKLEQLQKDSSNDN
jgi:hypothetical protein